ncbi:hypothetical protein [Comamonas thiooxydans]|uniref:hypothetical protein n=1 Tax=Comamonas thiooxydans TaxID=363952 RepID=UPI001CCE6830|nr:hypothetical protein [Comamonas thiooxydans]UBQ44612.1 hypothetical protein LCH15_26020 [Comamonas thiooxydans]
MLTTRRFNRRRAAEIRARHRERRDSRQFRELILASMHSWRCGAMGIFDPSAPRLPGETFEQAFARFNAERLRVLAEADRQADIDMLRRDAGQACGAAVAAYAKKPRGILATVLGWLPWR